MIYWDSYIHYMLLWFSKDIEHKLTLQNLVTCRKWSSATECLYYSLKKLYLLIPLRYLLLLCAQLIHVQFKYFWDRKNIIAWNKWKKTLPRLIFLLKRHQPYCPAYLLETPFGHIEMLDKSLACNFSFIWTNTSTIPHLSLPKMKKIIFFYL